MSLVQFLRILWARRLLIGAATLSCLVGAVIVILIVPPRYDGKARVMLNMLRPDPVTGDAMASNSARTYLATQAALAQDATVAAEVVDRLGWQSEPSLIQAYQNRASSDQRDFRTWLAQEMIVKNTKAVPVDMASTILEITYSGNSPREARDVVDALRDAYITTSLNVRREDAKRNADWYLDQAGQARKKLAAAEEAMADFERRNGIMMAGDKVDVDTARLEALAGQSAGVAVNAAEAVTPSQAQLSQLDAEIAQASNTLGPNHPQMLAMKARRVALAAAAAREASDARHAAAASASAGGAIDRAVQEQKAKVMSQSDKVARLRLMQSEVELRREEVSKTEARAAELNQEAAAADVGMTPLGAAVAAGTPSFPKLPLIFGGALGLGLGIGVLASLLLELLMRRVRGSEDLQLATTAPVLAVINAPGKPGKHRKTLGGLGNDSPEGMVA